MARIFVECKKDLVHGDGTLSFKKGNIYLTGQYFYFGLSEFNERSMLINERGEIHAPGIWVKYFKPIKLGWA